MTLNERPPAQQPAPPAAEAMQTAAVAWATAGFSALKLRLDGSKAPLGEWTTAQQTRATVEQVRAWFKDGHHGLGIVCGKVSGNLEMLELEGRAVQEGLRERLREGLRSELWAKLNAYREMSPSGGLHFLYRVEGVEVPGNLKLARRPSTDAELATRRAEAFAEYAGLSTEERAKRMARFDTLTGVQVPQVLAETRGEGGQVVVAPSGGTVHESGRPWVLAQGCTPGVVATLTAAERDEVLAVVRSFDQMPPPRQSEPRRSAPAADGEERPGDAFARQTSWHDILEPHDWTTGYHEGNTLHWTRPGKRWGTSATTGYGDSDLLYVFSSSTEFEPETTYTKFGAYALLEHGGDYAAAAAQLRREGFGDRTRQLAPDPFSGAQEGAPSTENGDWDEPIPLSRTPVPEFPVQVLPETLREYVQAEATHTQTPADLPGILVLLALATATGGKYRVQAGPQWVVPVNMYALVSLPPASRKSPVFKDVTVPLYEAEAALQAQAAPDVRNAQQRQRIAESALSKAERKASDNPTDFEAMAAAEGAAKTLAELVVPTMPRLLADDVTPEALVSLLADHIALGLLSSEGGFFETIGGRYQNGVANLDGVLKAWAGEDIRVDRKGSEPRRVQGAALTLGLTVQPAVLASMAKVPDFTGRGLVQRFMYAIPDMTGRIGSRDVDAPPVPRAVRAAYEAIVYELAMLPRPASPVTLQMSPDGARAFRAWRQELEPRRNPDTGDLADVVEWSGKLEDLTARIAGLLHLARHGTSAPDTIALEEVAAAIGLGRYAIPHAQAAHDLMSGRENNGPARSLLRVIGQKRLAEFSAHEMHKYVGGQVQFCKIDAVTAALSVLTEAGYIRPLPAPPRESGKPGRGPSPRYEVNPAWLAQEGAR
jgi:replicative DNA helicase